MSTVINTELWQSDDPRVDGGAPPPRPSSSDPHLPPVPQHMVRDPADGPKLNRKQREELLKRYRDRIEWARAYRKHQEFDARWHLMIDFYAGRQWPDTVTTEVRLVVNITKSTVDVIAPSVAINYPKIVVKAQDSDRQNGAQIVEMVVNQWWRHFDINPEFRSIVKDYLVVGFGFAKCGYRFVQSQVPCEDSDIVAYKEEMYAQVDQHVMDNPEMADSVPTTEEIDAGIPSTKVVVEEDRPFITRVSPFDVYVDPEATSFRDMRWISQKIIKTMTEVLEDTRYETKARKSVRPDGQIDMFEDSSEDIKLRDAPPDHQRVTVWEFYDLHTNTLSVFTEQGDDFLVRPRYMPYKFGHPFVMLRNYDIPDEFYPMGEVEAILPIQEELNQTRSDIVNHRRRYIPKYLADLTRLDNDAMAALVSDEPNAIVGVNDPNKPLAEAIQPIAQSQIPSEMYNWGEQIVGDADRVTAVNEYQRGAPSEIRRTATEANIIQDAANARAADKVAQVEAFVTVCARHLVQLAQQYASEDQVVRVANKQGYDTFWTFDKEDIQGEFTFEVVAGSTKPVNEESRRQTAIGLLQAMAPYAQAGIVDIQKLLTHTLKYGFGVEDAASWLAPPQQQQQPDSPDPTIKVIESIAYKDLPPDVQRQLEEKAGFNPSTIGGASPTEKQDLAAETKTVLAAAKSHDQGQADQQKMQHEREKHALDMEQKKVEMASKVIEMGLQHGQDASMQDSQQQHERTTQIADQSHQSATQSADQGHQANQARLQRQHDTQQAAAQPKKKKPAKPAGK